MDDAILGATPLESLLLAGCIRVQFVIEWRSTSHLDQCCRHIPHGLIVAGAVMNSAGLRYWLKPIINFACSLSELSLH